VTAKLRRSLLPVPIENDEIRLLQRHMAINTVARGVVARLWEHGGSLSVATHATLRIGCRIALFGVNVVASQTCHCR